MMDLRPAGKIVTAMVLAASFTFGQTPATSDETVRALREQIQLLETRIQALENGAKSKPEAVATRSDAPLAAPANLEHSSATMLMQEEVASAEPAFKIRGFGEMRFLPRSGDTPSRFGRGQLDLFMTSRLSEHLSALVETVFESDLGGEGGFDLERAALNWRANRFLNAEVGRYHTGIGYYNTSFHHGVYFQTAVDRPLLFGFEDEGGLLPIHNVGLSLTGNVPSGPLGLHYRVELSNGRSYASPHDGNAARPEENSDGKASSNALNTRFWLTPDAWQGLQVGGSFYRDKFLQQNTPTQQHIYAGHIVYIRNRVEFLNEVVWMRHSRTQNQGKSAQTSIPGFYSQFSYGIGGWRPYFRYESLNPSMADPVAQSIMDSPGWLRKTSAGLRYDIGPFAAVKLQVDRLTRECLDPAHQVTIQLAFAF